MGLLDHVSLAAVASTALAYLICLVFYRLSIHPLAKFPGPKLAAITRYYEGYYDVVLNGQYTLKIAELHQQYGPIVRISPYELHINDPPYYEKLYRQEGRWNKYDWSYDAFGAPMSSVCTVDHDIHKRRRAPLNAFFSKVSVASRQDMIQRFANKLCDRFAQFEGSTVNVTAAISAFTRDVAMKFVLSKDYQNLDDENFGVEMTNVLRKQCSSPSTVPRLSSFGSFRNAMLWAQQQVTNIRIRELGSSLARDEARPMAWTADEVASFGLGRKGKRYWDQGLLWLSES